MKLVKKVLERDKSGSVTLVAEDGEDLWHVYNLILPGDQLTAATVRRLQIVNQTGSTDGSTRQRMTLTISVEQLDFDAAPTSGQPNIRINGRVCRESEFVAMGQYHTIELELHRNFAVYKSEWDSVVMQRVELACDVTARAEVAALLMQDGAMANLLLVTDAMSQVRQKIDVLVARKGRGTSSQHDKSMQKFFNQSLQALLRHVNFQVVKCVIVASPGFLKDQFWQHVLKEMQRVDSPDAKILQQNKHKFVLMHSTSAHKQALIELMQDPQMRTRLADTRFATETQHLQDFFKMLNDQPARAYYGWRHVQTAVEMGAVNVLLVTDTLFRSTDHQRRRDCIRMVEQVQQMGGTVCQFSSMHTSGEQLDQLTGIAAILSYPAPQIEDEDSAP